MDSAALNRLSELNAENRETLAVSVPLLRSAADRVRATPRNVPPVVSITTPSSAQTFTLGQAVLIGGTVIDSDPDRVEVYQVFGNVATLIYSTSLKGPPSITSFNTADIPPAGAVTYRVKAYDVPGLVSTVDVPVTVVDVVTPPPGGGPLPAGSINVALVGNGAAASASSSATGLGPANAIDGDRAALNFNFWNDATPSAFPDWLQVTFAAAQSIAEIDVFSLQDTASQGTGVAPTPTMTATVFGLTDFQVQYLSGSTFLDVPGGLITGNTLVWRKISLATPLSTTAIRVRVNNAHGGVSRIAQLEAWSNGPPNPWPPIATLNSPSNGQAFVSPATIGLVATLTGGSDIKDCVFFQDGVAVATDTTAPYTASVGPLSDGTYIFKARGRNSINQFTDSATATITVQTIVVTDGNWDARSAGALYKVKFDSDADIGALLSGAAANQSLSGQYYLPNPGGLKPVFDPVMRAMRFTIPGWGGDSNASGSQYSRFPAMSTNGNDSYWFQFRRRGDHNYFYTLYLLPDGTVQLGLKQFTAGPGYTAISPQGQTSTDGKWVFTNIYGYRFISTYRRNTVGSDTSRFNYQNSSPACKYPEINAGGTTQYPVPMPPNNPCWTGSPDQWETILVNFATGPKVANPSYPGPSQYVSYVYQNTRIRWWKQEPGETSYALIDDETCDFNAVDDDPDHGVFGCPISIGQFLWETYFTGGLTPPGVDANWWVKEFIVKQLPASTAPEAAIAIPADNATLPTWVPTTPSTIASIALNTIASQDPCPSNTCPYYQPGAGGNERISGAWSFTGMIYAPHCGAQGSYVFNSGGHASHFGNFIFVFDKATRLWRQAHINIYNADAFTAIDYPYGNWEGVTGQMASNHSFDSTEYLPPSLGGGSSGSLLMLSMGAAGNTPVQRPCSHRFDLANGTFSLYAMPSTADGVNNTVTETPCFFDSTRNYYWRVWNTGSIVDFLDPLSTPSVSTPHGTVRQWQSIGVPGGTNFVQGNVGIYCPTLDCAVVMDAVGSATDGNVKIYALRLNNIQAGWTNVTDSLPNGMGYMGKAKSIDWVPGLNKFAIYQGSNTAGFGSNPVSSNVVIWLTPPVSWGGTWTWSTETFTGDTPAAEQFGNGAFCYKRLRWDGDFRCLAWAMGVFNNGVQLWKPAGT
jgi:hypothetical protein